MHIAKNFRKYAIQINPTFIRKGILKNVIPILIIGLLLSTVSYAQSASAIWALTADTASAVTGNITAPVQVLSRSTDTLLSMSVKDYNGSDTVGAAERLWLDGHLWPTETSKNSGRYIQYSVSPISGNNLTVQSVTLNIGCSGSTSSIYASISYSTDSTFATSTELYPATPLIDIRTNHFTSLSFIPGTFVNDGQTFYVRIYPWLTSTSANPSKYICITNMVISGTTVAVGVPSLTVLPVSLSFGTTNINTSRDKSFSISGTLLSPVSGDITITAPTDFTVSTTNGSGYVSSITLPYTSGVLNDTTIYARFTPTAIASYMDSILVSGGEAPTQNVAVTGTGVASDVILGIFVSTTGSDTNSGTFDDPFATITKAVSVAQVGDTIFVRGGTYSLTITITLSASGTDSSNRYYLFAYGSERPVLDFSSMSFGSSNRGIILSGSYWHIKGLDIYKAGDNGMNITGSNNIVEFCELYENRDTGLQLSGNASNNQIINCDSYYNYDAPNSGGNADGFSPKQLTGINNYFYGCRAWQNSDDGWDCYEAVASVTIENCWTFSNGYLKDGITTNDDMNGNGFKMGGNYTENDATLKNCIAFNNKSKGFDQNHNRGSMTLINCTGYGNSGYNYSISEALDAGKTLTFTNCAELGGKISIGAFAILTTNSWQSLSVTAADFVSVDTTGVRGPRKADGSLPDIDFMHLAQGSQLINAGTNVGLPYNGSAPDLGCFESNWPSGVNDENASIVSEYKLLQNYPNPFNPSTKISYSVGTYSHTSLRVYDLLGREIRTLVDGMRTAGNYNVEWDGKNSAGQTVGSGIYFYQLRCGSGFTETRKMIFMK
jgi:hypothetical protein